MAKPYENETYIEWYTRKFGSIHAYPELTQEELGRRRTRLQCDLGAILIYLRHDPASVLANEMLALLETHYEAARAAARA